MNDERRDALQPRSMPGYTLPVYPFRIPPELTGAQAERYPVVIVGAGLSGLTLAAELGIRGVPTIILDDDDTIGAAGISSRGVSYARRSLEIFDKLGIAERICAKGVEWRSGRVFRGAQELFKFDLQADQKTHFPPFVNIQQFYVEEYLVDRLKSFSSVDIRWLNKVEQIYNCGDHVRVVASTPEGNYELSANWLVAADGSQSTVRTSMGLTRQANLFDDQWCIADIRTPLHLAAERRVWISADFNDGGAVFFHRMADEICRFDFQIGHYPDPERRASRDEIVKRIRLAMGENAEFELVWAGIWRFKTRVMEAFRHGRVLFVGDAAHELPPFGGRGGNGGIQDANNLGWKLALIHAGRASASLLESYNDERRSAAIENIEQATRSALFLRPETAGQRLFREAVCDLAPLAPEVRPMINTGRLSTASVYPRGTLVLEDEGEFVSGPAAGSALPDGPIMGSAQGYLSAAVPADFFALHFVAPDQPELWDCPSARIGGNEVPNRRIVLHAALAGPQDWVDSSGCLFDSYDAMRGATYLVRPDGHILLRTRRSSVDVPWTSVPAASVVLEDE